jgi:uncharacterized repeat protein (TIGR03803 family)
MGEGDSMLSIRITAIGLRVAGLTALTVLTLGGGAHAAAFKVLYSFCSQANCADGEEPEGTPVLDAKGNVFGTTIRGGAAQCAHLGSYSCGIVYRITSSGAESVLHAFTGKRDGAAPFGDIVMDSDGNIYGTTTEGGEKGCGDRGCGTVFEVSRTGAEAILYSFCSEAHCTDGRLPWSGVIADEKGNLYGTTDLGGAHGFGTVFEITRGDREKVLYSFAGQGDGASPVAGLLRDAAGNLYGTTASGGKSGCGGGLGCGTVFKLGADGTHTVLYAFAGGSDGAGPGYGKLTVDREGNLYGTTANGGGTGCGGPGCGTVFRVTPDGTESVIYAFCSQVNCVDGSIPWSGVISDKSGNLFATTSQGGAGNYGVVSTIATNGEEDTLDAFDGSNGSAPYGGLAADSTGHFFGTTASGGPDSNNQGVLFELRK